MNLKLIYKIMKTCIIVINFIIKKITSLIINNNRIKMNKNFNNLKINNKNKVKLNYIVVKLKE